MKLRNASNALRTVKAIHMRTPANVSRMVKRLHVRDASNTSRIAAGTGTAGTAMTAEASPNYVFGAVSSHGPQRVYTNATTVTVTGGTPPYSFAWTVDSGFDVLNPTSASTAFLSPSIGPGDGGVIGVAGCLVTDSSTPARTAYTNDVTASADNYGI